LSVVDISVRSSIFNCSSSFEDRSARYDFIIKKDHIVAGHIANHTMDLYATITSHASIYDRKGQTKALCISFCDLGSTDIGSNNNEVFPPHPFIMGTDCGNTA